MKPLVTVLVPVFNGTKYLENTINTLLAQDYENFEILLINDGSTDSSAKLVDKLAAEHTNIRAFHKPNGGVAAARNFGIARAEGELIAFCDQDDLWFPNKLSKQVPLFLDEKVGLVFCGAVIDYEFLHTQKNQYLSTDFRGNVFERLIQENFIICCTAIARKSLLIETQAFDAERGLMGVDDWLAWLKLALVSELDFVPEHLATYVLHGNNYSSNEPEMHKAELICLNKIQEIAKPHNKNIDWLNVTQNVHVRYATNFIHNQMFDLAGETLLQAASLKNNKKLKIKGLALKSIPNSVLRWIQTMKR
ncbi:MAG: glycosyltransferase [Paraglaciecola sp.]|nr:glycosyltransferase [Paraglaciecola sp.]